MLTITPQAAAEVQRVMAEHANPGFYLRISCHPGPEGLEFGMALDEAQEEDLKAECTGVEVLLDPITRQTLMGVVLDCVEHEGRLRFVFIPPSSCSTGSGCSTGGCGGCGSGH